MIKTFKYIKLTSLTSIVMFLFLNNVFAQEIIFPSAQWPKRWERVMHHRPMNGYIIPARMNSFRKVSRSGDNRYRGWGQHQNKQRYERSRTPEYNYQLYGKYRDLPLTQRYTTPEYLNYGGYPTTPYYGNLMPAYPTMYPNSGVPGLGMPGLGVPGFTGMGLPYATPFYMAPGLYPGMGYPW